MKQYNLLSTLLMTFSLFCWAGCQGENFDGIYSGRVRALAAKMKDKSDAAQSLQSIIRSSYGISVHHCGFKPRATPPSFPPRWTPQEVLEVDESGIRTRYEVQHWIEEKTTRKMTLPDIAGYATEFYRWQGIDAGRTSHEVNIPFESVSRVSV
ncbi:MAG: hypothetical protein ACYS76_10210 [Planctomycetota bacterium]